VIDDVYEKASYDKFWDVQEGFKILDVGANIGVYTLKMAKKAGCKGFVISAEPEDENFLFLQKNIAINELENVIPVKAALSDFEGKGTLFLSASGSGEHSLVSKSENKIEVPVFSVEGLMRRLKIESLDLMKIDVEGAEIQVLKGSIQMLKEKRIRRIVVAAYHNPNECREVTNYLTAFDYKVKEDNSYVYAQLGEQISWSK
jgi:FkbM family methyltransferase